MEEFKEKVEIIEEEDNEPPEVRKSILPDPGPRSPTTDVSIRGGGRDEGRKTEGTISATLGAMVPLVGKLGMLLAPQGRSSKRVKDVIRLLKADVEQLSTYLVELSEVEDPPSTAMCWMNEARDLSYDMEDYIRNLQKQLEDPSFFAKTTRALRKLTSHGKTPKRFVRTVSEFRMHVQEAIQRHEVYGLSDSGPSSVSILRRRFLSVGPMLPTPYEETSEIVIDGRMNDFITSLAKDGDQRLKVVSVFGSACLGKTTLARVWYNRYAKQYNCRAFIRVSRKPDMKRIFRDILSQLQEQHPPKLYQEIHLIDSIKKYLQDKRYLIVIDDLCTASAWNIINQAFPKGSHGSRIIITTQIEDVALTCCSYQSEHVFEIKPLDEDHSRKLFFNRLFGSESYCPQQLKEILTEIVEICGGLPLATVSIASLLASQPVITVDHLTYIYQSLSSCFSANSTSERTRQALNLSFNNLPQYLRTCLLYLSMREEGYTFCKDDLLKQWMAERFIDATEGQDAEKVAESYFDELIGRRFIQPIRINYHNEVVSCAVYDAVHDLIAHKSAEENFIVGIDYSQMNVALSRKVRRLSLLFGDAGYAKTPANIRKTQVRSLTFVGLLECMPCITEFKLLCVLNLQLSDHGDNDPVDLAAISELFQLRYLKIASDVCIKLPKYGLECLETLDIMDARIAMDGIVPCVPYIHLPHLLHVSIPDEMDLIKWIYNLVLEDKLNYLQDLHITTSSTSNFYYLQRLMASRPHKLKTIVVRAASSVKNAVNRGADEIAPMWNCEKLPALLQRFEFVTHYGHVFSKIPLSVKNHGHLSILKIEVKDLEMSCVDILRGLPALTALSLYVQIAPFHRITFDKAGFSVLKYFKLRFRSGIAWLNFEANAMPNLWKLKLVFDAIPPMEQQLSLFSNRPLLEQHKRGTALISIKHMPGLAEISVKFGGAAADVDHALRVSLSNHPSNPTINKQPVDYSLYGDERSKLKQQQQPDEILVEGQDEYDQKQPDECYQQEPDKILEEEPDEYYKQQPDDNLNEESVEYNEQQPDDNLGTARDFISQHGWQHNLRHALMLSFIWRGKRNLKSPRHDTHREPELQGGPRSTKIHGDHLQNTNNRRFTYKELKKYTNKFERVIGRGGSGLVYYGCLEDGSEVAVKGRSVSSSHGLDKLLAEVHSLTKVHHKNLVSLIGYCWEKEHLALVYEYMSRGNLRDHLRGKNGDELSDWATRVRVVLEAAQGLDYLHKGCSLPIIHRDVKTSNILLDKNLRAKVADFGLCETYISETQTHVSTFGAGSEGYYDPEYYLTGTLTESSDVYSFGVVLLEIATGEPPIVPGHGHIVRRVEQKMATGNISLVVDARLSGAYEVNSMWKVVDTAMACTAHDSFQRPTMAVVVAHLKECLALEEAH